MPKLEPKRTRLHYKKLHVEHALGIVNPIAKLFLEEMIENSLLFDAKHSDYGPYNITRIGLEGVLNRAEEKLIRVNHLLKNAKGVAKNESVEDSLRDLSNYATIALLLHAKKWPKR